MRYARKYFIERKEICCDAVLKLCYTKENDRNNVDKMEIRKEAVEI